MLTVRYFIRPALRIAGILFCLSFARCSIFDFQNVPNTLDSPIVQATKLRESSLSDQVRKKAQEIGIIIDANNATTFPYPLESGPFGEDIIYYAIEKSCNDKQDREATAQLISYLVQDLKVRSPEAYRLIEKEPQHIQKIIDQKEQWESFKVLFDFKILKGEENTPAYMIYHKKWDKLKGCIDFDVLSLEWSAYYHIMIEQDCPELLKILIQSPRDFPIKSSQRKLELLDYIVNKEKRNLAEHVSLYLQLNTLIDKDGNNILHKIILKNWDTGLEDLLKGGAKKVESIINQRNKVGETPLTLAITQNSYQMVKQLLNKDANPTLTNSKNKTPLKVAEENEQAQANEHPDAPADIRKRPRLLTKLIRDKILALTPSNAAK